ncbi:MAG: DNA alkylation repair protein [Rhodothermales bacterium]|nr:DNA alkylation repair protein [Rhodothermales bacterium]
MTSSDLTKALRELANPEIAAHSQRFFKTGKGEYGEGDVFLGIRVPVLRKQATKFKDLSLANLSRSLKSQYNEVRLCTLFILVKQFERGNDAERKKIYDLYLESTEFVNNWDLVDSSAHKIVGPHLVHRDRRILTKLAKSKSLWERRISIMSTLEFIRRGDYADTLAISEILLNDPEDLIHKAVGWMLREVGNKDPQVERRFLATTYDRMPRTMLRYAIEKFPDVERKKYLNGEV